MKTITLVYLLFFLNVSYAKYLPGIIHGHITSKVTGEPLIGVNVYLSQTTIGTSTNSNGYYEISNVPLGEYTLVASMIGFDAEYIKFYVHEGSKKINISLNEKTYKFSEVIVKVRHPVEWYKNRDIFYKYFLGQTALADKCTIENSEILEFKREAGRLYALANEPIIITNDVLGYKIHCNLKTFYHDEKMDKSWVYMGYFYEELKTESNEQKETWIKNREQTYNSSITHFLRWLLSGQLEDLEYKMINISRLPLGIVEPSNRYIMDKEKLIIKIDSLNEYKLTFEDYLKIINNKTNKASYIKLLYDTVTIDRSGYPKEIKPFEVYGDWGIEGMANQLPKDYQFRED